MNSDLRIWNILMGVSVAALAGLLAFDLLAPMPTANKRMSVHQRNAKKVRDETYMLRDQYETTRKEIEARVWTGSADTVSAKSLELATQVAKSKGMRLTAFRPQKPVEEGELTRLSFVMTLEGPYPGLQGVVKELETPSHRISVHLVQVASADEASDLVNATVGIAAFLEKPKAKPELKDKKT